MLRLNRSIVVVQDTHKKLKIAAAQADMKIKDLLAVIIDDYLISKELLEINQKENKEDNQKENKKNQKKIKRRK